MNFTRWQPCGIPADHKGPRIAIISSWNEHYEPIADIAAPNWIAYCERHGYCLRFYPGEYHEDPNRPESFGDKGKFRLYHDMRGHVDYVMWLDIDSLFTNMERNVQDAMQGSFLWTYDDNGPLSGLWIARTDDTTERHLRAAYERAAVECNARHGRVEPNGISDQDSMTRLMNVPPFRQTFGYHNLVDAASLGHCYESNWEPGKWLITFPGMSRDEKVRNMSEWRSRVDNLAVRP